MWLIATCSWICRLNIFQRYWLGRILPWRHFFIWWGKKILIYWRCGYRKIIWMGKGSHSRSKVGIFDLFPTRYIETSDIHHHHHHIALVARISLTLSRHSSLSFIALGRSSGQHPVSSHSCWMYVRAGRPAFARPCVGVHKSTSLMSSSLLLQQCPACLARLTWIVFVIGGRWPYSWCLVGCCRQDYTRMLRAILNKSWRHSDIS